MNLRPTPSLPRRSLLTGLLLASVASLAVGWTAGTVAASSGSHASPTALPTTSRDTGGVALGAPEVGQVSAPGVVSGSAGSSLLYPYPINTALGVAPEHTILAAGAGTADMKADGSDRAAATSKATTAALADARAQAEAVATAMGVSITGTYSVSVSASDNYVYPATDCAVPAPLVPAPATGGTTSSGGTGTVTIAPAPAGSPAVCIQGKVPSPSATQVVVTVVVAYSFA